MRLRHWAPPLAWMGVIFWLSGGAGAQEVTASWAFPPLRVLLPWATTEQLAFVHLLVRKLAHVIEYGVLAFLWHRAFRHSGLAGRGTGWRAFVITAAYATFDELHQGWTGVRSASASDAILDAAGAGATLLLLRVGWRSALTFFTGLLLWVAALGGTLLLLLNLLVRVRGRWLWISAPLGWIALWCWRRWRRRPAFSP